MKKQHRAPAIIAGTACVIGAALILPTIIVTIISFSTGSLLSFPPPDYGLRWYENFFTDARWTSGASISLKIAVFSSVLATILGTLTALGLHRGRIGGWAQAFMLSPIIVPQVITSVGMFFFFSRFHLIGTMASLVLAHTVLALPLVVVSVLVSLQRFDPVLEQAAENLGANRLQTFGRVTLPLILPGVLTGAIFAFVTSWDEVVIALFVSSTHTRTLPVVIWTQVRSTVDPTVAAAATMLTLLTLGLLALSSRLGRGARS